ncbi:DUF1385 domain-containing protein [Shouchella sp. JSM 1781072]|uniref:DUF1385 domain-containing protein n=1 Tax=Bacillaceae TaxID=186817 RepID=UPI0020D007AC|nr:DUF1385 domain-containing protein [Alkalihalobacillus sp. LMS6]UTR07999.1 DUF1385 domain-containing protein [Alkalihalobacillus sp. LMS6]
MANQTLACAYHDKKGTLHAWAKPRNMRTFLLAGQLVWRTAPLWFQTICVGMVLLIIGPKLLPIEWAGLPFYSFFYLLFGTHFFFPSELKRYHAAEHKVFSTVGRVNHETRKKVARASVRNRGCSTGLVVLYFLSTVVLTAVAMIVLSFTSSLASASYLSLLVVFLYAYNRNIVVSKKIDQVILPLSYWLQENVTTKTPEKKHLESAIESYIQLAKVEFSPVLYQQRIEKREEEWQS